MSGKLKPNSVSLSRRGRSAKTATTAPGSVVRNKNAKSSVKNSIKDKQGGDGEAALVEDEIDTSNLDGASTTPITGSSYNSLGGMGMGGMGMGMGMMGGMNPMMMGMYGGGMGMYGMGNQWVMSLNQFLFGIQSVVFSLGQAMQIVGMNAQQIKHMYESVKGMVDNAICKLHNMSIEETLGVNGDEARRWMLGNEENEHQRPLTQNEIIRRRRLAAIRWSMTLGISYLLYKSIRKLIRALMGGRNGGHRRNLPAHQYQNFDGGGYGMNRHSGYGNSYGSGFGRQGFSQHSQYGGAHGGYY